VGGRHIAINRGEQYLESKNQLAKVGGDPEATRKRCDRRGDNMMMPTTTSTMKRQSISTYQMMEEDHH
jgi:hypothetical protein